MTVAAVAEMTAAVPPNGCSLVAAADGSEFAESVPLIVARTRYTYVLVSAMVLSVYVVTPAPTVPRAVNVPPPSVERSILNPVAFGLLLVQVSLMFEGVTPAASRLVGA